MGVTRLPLLHSALLLAFFVCCIHGNVTFCCCCCILTLFFSLLSCPFIMQLPCCTSRPAKPRNRFRITSPGFSFWRWCSAPNLRSTGAHKITCLPCLLYMGAFCASWKLNLTRKHSSRWAVKCTYVLPGVATISGNTRFSSAELFRKGTATDFWLTEKNKD